MKAFPEGLVRSDRMRMIVREAASLAQFEAQELVRDGFAADAVEAARRRAFYLDWLAKPAAPMLSLHPWLAAAIRDHATPDLDRSLLAIADDALAPRTAPSSGFVEAAA